MSKIRFIRLDVHAVTSKPAVIGAMEVPWDLSPDNWIASRKNSSDVLSTHRQHGCRPLHRIYLWNGAEVPNPILKGFSYDARFFRIGENTSKDKLAITSYIAGFDQSQ